MFFCSYRPNIGNFPGKSNTSSTCSFGHINPSIGNLSGKSTTLRICFFLPISTSTSATLPVNQPHYMHVLLKQVTINIYPQTLSLQFLLLLLPLIWFVDFKI
eukprot:g83481.t1